ncbi:MAG: septum formation initiator family protein [Firmicutes bacterium]|nr:septum formation initiator family protein [Bacillota bacterium]
MSHRLFTVLGIMVVVCVGVSYISGFMRLHAINQDIRRVEEEAAAWEKRILELQVRVDEAKSDAYAERVAREQLGLVKPGETLYIVAEPYQGEFTPVRRRPGPPPEIGD